MRAGGPIPGDLQAHLAVARVPTSASFMAGMTSKSPGGRGARSGESLSRGAVLWLVGGTAADAHTQPGMARAPTFFDGAENHPKRSLSSSRLLASRHRNGDKGITRVDRTERVLRRGCDRRFHSDRERRGEARPAGLKGRRPRLLARRSRASSVPAGGWMPSSSRGSHEHQEHPGEPLSPPGAQQITRLNGAYDKYYELRPAERCPDRLPAAAWPTDERSKSADYQASRKRERRDSNPRPPA